jgi:hypothetical protein
VNEGLAMKILFVLLILSLSIDRVFATDLMPYDFEIKTQDSMRYGLEIDLNESSSFCKGQSDVTVGIFYRYLKYHVRGANISVSKGGQLIFSAPVVGGMIRKMVDIN